MNKVASLSVQDVNALVDRNMELEQHIVNLLTPVRHVFVQHFFEGRTDKWHLQPAGQVLMSEKMQQCLQMTTNPVVVGRRTASRHQGGATCGSWPASRDRFPSGGKRIDVPAPHKFLSVFSFLTNSRSGLAGGEARVAAEGPSFAGSGGSSRPAACGGLETHGCGNESFPRRGDTPRALLSQARSSAEHSGA
eukprot:2089759-Rhodomonas_salina.2